MKYTTENIDKRIETINKIYNNTDNNELKKDLEKEFNVLNTRAIINSYLYYGYGLKTFLENDYECAKNLDIKKLWQEQTKLLGSLD